MPFAARITDPTTHGTPLAPGPGAVTVLIGNLFAWRTLVDQHVCPAVSISGADGVGSVALGSPTVYIASQMACRMGDIVLEKPGLALGPLNPILMGCATVDIGGPVASMSIAGGVMTATFGAITMTGSPQDVQQFAQLLALEASRSETVRVLIATLATDAANPTSFTLVRNDPGVWVDAYDGNGNQRINMDYFDGGEFPDSPSATHPDACTQGENLVHGMSEAHRGAVLQNSQGNDPSGNNWFPQSHQHGINTENSYRDDRGQPSHLVSSNSGPGPNDTTFSYDNGTSEVHDTQTGAVTHRDAAGNPIP